MQRRVIPIVLALLVMSVGLHAEEKLNLDRWVGTWVYNFDKSTHDEESAVKMKRVFELYGTTGMKFTRDAINAHGQPQHSVHIVKTFDGKGYTAEGNPNGGTVSYRQIDDNTLECISKSTNGTSMKQVLVLAKDGKSFVLTETGKYGNGKTANHYSYFEKQ